MRARAVAAIALSGALALTLSGCNLVLSAETARPYDQSDGVNFNVGGLQLRNVLVVTEDGDLGNLVGSAVNTTSSDIDFVISWEVDGTRYEVALTATANGRTDLGFGAGGQVTLQPVGAKPGDLLEVYVQHGTETGASVLVPVLDATLVEYTGLLPVPTPTPTPSDIPTDLATDEVEPAS